MNLRGFYKTYREILIEKSKEEDFLKTYKDSTEYAKLVKKIMQQQITEKFNSEETKKVTDYPEFFKVDHTFWKESGIQIEKGVKIYDWEQVAVVEHENDKGDWTYEVAKLDYIKAPLKVVIGFRDNRENDEIILKKQAEELKHFTENEEFGVILMNDTFDLDSEDHFDMLCYQIIVDENGNRVEPVML